MSETARVEARKHTKEFSPWERFFLFPFILGLLVGAGGFRTLVAATFAVFGGVIGFALGRMV